jgi:hypothetical protein
MAAGVVATAHVMEEAADPTAPAVAEQPADDSRCAPMEFESRSPGTTLDAQQRCALVAAGYRAVASGAHEATGVPASDTAAIAAAAVRRFDFPDLDGGDTTSYWSVDFELRERPYAVQAQVDVRTGAVTVGRVHR